MSFDIGFPKDEDSEVETVVVKTSICQVLRGKVLDFLNISVQIC